MRKFELIVARLETFTDPIDLEFLFGYSDDDDEEGKPIQKSKKRRMRERVSLQLAETASSYGLVKFNPLVVTDERLIRMVIAQVKNTFRKMLLLNKILYEFNQVL